MIMMSSIIIPTILLALAISIEAKSLTFIWGKPQEPKTTLANIFPYKLGANTRSTLTSNRNVVSSLSKVVPYGMKMSDIDLLRFALAHPNDEVKARQALEKTIEWRQTAGKRIVNAAREAFAEATANNGEVDKDVLLRYAPHADIINKYITSKAVITTSTEEGDLVSVIRPSSIDDKKLMDNATPEQVCEYFLYFNELHNIMANKRSKTTGRLCTMIVANDSSGARRPPDSRFSKALKLSADLSESLYPSLTGPTMILNMPLPGVAIAKSLLPKSTRERVVFKKAPVLASLTELTPLGKDMSIQALFLREVKDLLAS